MTDPTWCAVVAPDPAGVVVTVWVVPRSRRNEVVGLHGDALRVRVTAPPEGGRANAAAARLVAAAVGGRAAHLVAGATARRKRFLVPGVALDEALALLCR